MTKVACPGASEATDFAPSALRSNARELAAAGFVVSQGWCQRCLLCEFIAGYHYNKGHAEMSLPS